MMRRTFTWWSTYLLAAVLFSAVEVRPISGQTLPVVAKKKLAFEVVSIRPSKPGSNGGFSWVTSSDGYRVLHQSIRSTIMMAYFPQGIAYWSEERLKGAPNWIDDSYDIEARVAAEDATDWQKQGKPLDQKVLLQEMLKSMLADRCGLAIHWVPSAMAGYELVVDKRGPKLTQSKEGEAHPQGVGLADGGVMVPFKRGEPAMQRFFGVSMGSFARQLAMMSMGRSVGDKTGLTGKYDFVLSWLDLDPDVNAHREGVVAFDDPNPLSHWDLEKLGLRVRPVKLPTQTLMIDHIERPSEN